MKQGKALRKCCAVAMLALGLVSLKVLPALANDGGFSVGLEGGWEKSLAGNKAISDLNDSKFKDSFAYGLNTAYRLPTGLALGLDVESFTMQMKDNLGKVTATPVMLTVGYQAKPENSGFGWHVFPGLVIALISPRQAI